MRPVLVIITDVDIYEAFQMPFVEDDHMIEQSRRQLPTNRSAMPFCRGLLKLVRFGWMPKLFMVSMTSPSKLDARSKIKYLGTLL